MSLMLATHGIVGIGWGRVRTADGECSVFRRTRTLIGWELVGCTGRNRRQGHRRADTARGPQTLRQSN